MTTLSMQGILARIMELQKNADPSTAEREELYALETAWSNHHFDDRDAPVRGVP